LGLPSWLVVGVVVGLVDLEALAVGQLTGLVQEEVHQCEQQQETQDGRDDAGGDGRGGDRGHGAAVDGFKFVQCVWIAAQTLEAAEGSGAAFAFEAREASGTQGAVSGETHGTAHVLEAGTVEQIRHPTV